MITDHEKIELWLDRYYIRKYTIRPDGVVDVNGDVSMRDVTESILPIQFGKVTGNFDCHMVPITSLKGFPHTVLGDVYAAYTKISSLEYAPQFVGGGFYCHNTNIKSLHGVDKMIKHIGNDFLCDNDGLTHVLGLLLIEGLTDIRLGGKDAPRHTAAIMNKYRGTGDILSAQDELIDAGFIDQARL